MQGLRTILKCNFDDYSRTKMKIPKELQIHIHNSFVNTREAQNTENGAFVISREFSCAAFFKFPFGYVFKLFYFALFIATHEVNSKNSKSQGA